MQHGIYTDVPFEEYASWDALSNSGMTLFERSPAHYKAGFQKETQALRLGSAIHECVTNIGLFQRTYIRGPENPKGETHKGLKYWKEAVKEVPDGKIMLAPEEYDMACQMRELLHEHETAGPILSMADQVECSMLWRDPDLGFDGKGRADILCSDIGAVVDLKTTEDASRFEFEKSIYNYNYHRQGAYYLRGLHALGRIEFKNFVIIAIEKKPPYAIAVYKLSKEALEQGEREINATIPRYASCIKNGRWPGYDTALTEIGLPAWANKKEK